MKISFQLQKMEKRLKKKIEEWYRLDNEDLNEEFYKSCFTKLITDSLKFITEINSSHAKKEGYKYGTKQAHESFIEEFIKVIKNLDDSNEIIKGIRINVKNKLNNYIT